MFHRSLVRLSIFQYVYWSSSLGVGPLYSFFFYYYYSFSISEEEIPRYCAQERIPHASLFLDCLHSLESSIFLFSLISPSRLSSNQIAITPGWKTLPDSTFSHSLPLLEWLFHVCSSRSLSSLIPVVLLSPNPLTFLGLFKFCSLFFFFFNHRLLLTPRYHPISLLTSRMTSLFFKFLFFLLLTKSVSFPRFLVLDFRSLPSS